MSSKLIFTSLLVILNLSAVSNKTHGGQEKSTSFQNISLVKHDSFIPYGILIAKSDTIIEEDIFACILEIEPEAYSHEEWQKYLVKNLVLDSISVDTIPTGTYTVLFRFSINEKGNLGEVTITKDPGFGFGQRVIEGMKNYSDKWKPASQNGKIVKTYRVQPITFIIEKDEECENALLEELIL
jgi:hypothetical protein